jgi:hypothetical protein
MGLPEDWNSLQINYFFDEVASIAALSRTQEVGGSNPLAAELRNPLHGAGS